MINYHSPFVQLFACLFGHFNASKYFKRRAIVTDPNDRAPLLLKYYFLFWIKRKDAKYGCSFGTNLHIGNRFASAPYLPHGPYGIVVGHDVELGHGVILYPMTTIPAGGGKIGSHSELGTKATVLKGITIGKYCHVGANAVATRNMPDYATVVMGKSRMILHPERGNRTSQQANENTDRIG